MQRPIAICVEGKYPLDTDRLSLPGYFDWIVVSTHVELEDWIVGAFTEPEVLVSSIASQDDLACISQFREVFPNCVTVGIIPASQKVLGYEAFKMGVEDVLTYPVSTESWEKALKKFCLPESRPGFLNTIARWLGKGYILGDNSPRPPSEKVDVPPPVSPPIKSTILVSPSILHDESEGEMMRVSLLGELNFSYNGQEMRELPKGKILGVWVYLLLDPYKPIPREKLIEIFWPGVGPESGRNSLNNAISKLRKHLKKWDDRQEFILLERECYRISSHIQVHSDLDAFQQAISAGKQWEYMGNKKEALTYYLQAAELFKGPFFVQNQQDDWVIDENAHLRENFLFVLDRLSNYYSNNGTPSLAITYCQMILNQDNCREDIHRRIMRCYYRLGKRDMAMRQFKRCNIILAKEFGPSFKISEETLSLMKKIQSDN